ncbi:MAG TPA: SRPBCC domain-containing protein [Actinopolymorphaceae bacterium]|jgi:uncharacterized protein YndB with AHSA1/START domain
MSVRPQSDTPNGTIEREGASTVLRFERSLAHGLDEVWAALVAPDAWLGHFVEPLVDGDTYRLMFEGLEMAGKVVELEPPNVLAFTWGNDVDSGEAVLRFELTPTGDRGTRLVFTATSDSRDFLAEGAAGWQGYVDALEAAADGDTIEKSQAGWAKFRDAYAEHFAVSPSLGAISEVDSERAITFRRLLAHAPAVVWSALTEPAELATWLSACRLDPHVGGTVRFGFGNEAAATGTVIEFHPCIRLTYSWSSPSATESMLRWDLADGPAGGIWLTLTHTVSSAENGDDLLAGWHLHLDALREALDGRDPGWREGAFEPMLALYARMH